MDVSDLHPVDDYSHRFFIWHEWIQANGPLTTENVFDYFTTSMFYDKQSNNQVLRMQTMHTGAAIANEAEELRRFTGVEFAVVHAQPPSMFVIHKRERMSPDDVRPLSAYFIMNNRIYQAPDVYTVLSNRLLTSLCSLQSSLDILRSRRPDYIPRTGFVWPIVDAATQTDDLKKKPTEEGAGPGTESRDVSEVPENKPKVPQRQQNSLLLMNAMRATALHSKTAFSASVWETNAENVAETPSAQGVRNSATPAPAPVTAKTPTTPQVSQEPPSRALPGAGKKKRKRTLVAPTA
ncbi:MED6 mediator sub complex component-domain-containing protein [Mycena rosella]|uniref:Mediator of RNA polymerase II transcription subunit 6 n=1 Tax=Mycena rosella TaxID=1033263 RepID=A0AAD7DL09_MYCRO|nr:MED6 mediator sub complex component-domain-containing protein [Mycena rosella]